MFKWYFGKKLNVKYNSDTGYLIIKCYNNTQEIIMDMNGVVYAKHHAKRAQVLHGFNNHEYEAVGMGKFSDIITWTHGDTALLHIIDELLMSLIYAEEILKYKKFKDFPELAYYIRNGKSVLEQTINKLRGK